MIKKLTLMSVMVVLCTYRNTLARRVRSRKCSLLLPLLLSVNMLTAQHAEPLFINGRIPDIPLGRIMNDEGTAATFYELLRPPGGLVIFSFWNSYCSTCIAQFGHENDLQQRYGDKVRFILVTAEDSATAMASIRKWEKQSNSRLALPVIVEDTLLHAYVRNLYLPNYAWFAADGRMIAQTSAYLLTEENISGLLIRTAHLKPRQKHSEQ